MPKKTAGFYAVAKGKQIGIYSSWDECKEQIHGVAGAKFKKFPTKEWAEDYIKGINGESSSLVVPQPEVQSREYEENTVVHSVQPVTTISSSNTPLDEFDTRLTYLENKLSSLIDHVTNAFTDIKRRLDILERRKIVAEQQMQKQEIQGAVTNLSV